MQVSSIGKWAGSPGVDWCRLVGASVSRATTERTAPSANSAAAPRSISTRRPWSSEGRAVSLGRSTLIHTHDIVVHGCPYILVHVSCNKAGRARAEVWCL